MMTAPTNKLLIVAANDGEQQEISATLDAAHRAELEICVAECISRAAQLASRGGYRAIMLNPRDLAHQVQAAAANAKEIEHLKAEWGKLERESRRLSQCCQSAYRFVDDVSHEFRTPLTVIKGFASILRDGLDGTVNDRQREHLDRILQQVNDLAALVNEIFELSQLEAGRLTMRRTICSPAEIVGRVQEKLQLGDPKSN